MKTRKLYNRLIDARRRLNGDVQPTHRQGGSRIC